MYGFWHLYHCGYFYWWLFCWSSGSLISTFSAISTFRLVTFHRWAVFCLSISTTVNFLSWWIHQLRENYCHTIEASLFHDKYWFTTALFIQSKLILFVETIVQRRKLWLSIRWWCFHQMFFHQLISVVLFCAFHNFNINKVKYL